MSALFGSVLRQAFKTFDRANSAAFTVNFAVLKQLADQLTFRDFSLSETTLLNDGIFQQPEKAPCTYVHIFENEMLSLSVFVMRGGYTMPLHDHPVMHGILRGIYGNMCVKSYTLQQQPPKKSTHENVLLARAEEPLYVNASTECAVLTPRERNFHEITALDGVAAFFDILSPPYDTDITYDIPGPDSKRHCRFYKATAQQQSSKAHIYQLEAMPAPISYYCDTAETPVNVRDCTFACASKAFGANFESKAEQQD